MVWALALGLASVPGPVSAQADPEASPTGILILDREQLFQRSLFGQRMQAELDAATAALAAEAQIIDERLMAEELALTEQRPTMDPADFRALADDFDARVTEIRANQVARTRDLQTQAERAQLMFIEATVPILLEIIQDRGAAVLMDDRAVLLSAESIDITEDAIAAVDAALGQGGLQPLVELPAAAP